MSQIKAVSVSYVEDEIYIVDDKGRLWFGIESFGKDLSVSTEWEMITLPEEPEEEDGN